MTGVRERRDAVVETPDEAPGQGRHTAFRVLAVVIAAIVAIGIGWIMFRDSGDETPIEDGNVSVTTADSTDEAQVGTNVEFPFGRFENRDSGLRIAVWNEDGTYTLNSRGIVVNGAYEIDGDVLTVLTDSLEPEGGQGTYNWTYEDDVLKFSVIGDGNRNRYAFITFPWTPAE